MSEIKAGSTDQSIEFVLLDATTGEPVTGLTIADLDATYTRTRSAAVKNDLTALGAANSAHADNQAIQIDATNAPGLYRVDFPDAAFASGAAFVTLTITGAAIKPAHQKFALPVNTNEDIFARLGAPAGASVSADLAAVKAETAAIVADTNELQTDWANGGRLDTILDARASQATADDILTDTGTTLPATLSTIAGYIDTEVGAIKGVTDKLDTALELDGAVYRYTANALELAPTGGSAPTASQIADEVQTRTIAAVTTVNGLAANVVTAAALAADAVAEIQSGLATASALADVPTANENADALLNRDMGAVSDTNSRSPLNALRFLRNKWSLAASTLTVTKEDDTTSAWTAAVTTSAGAEPITGSDPA